MRSLTNYSTLNVVCDEDCETLGCPLQVNHKNLSHHCWQTCLKLITDGGHHGYQSTVQFARQNCPLTSTSGLFWHLGFNKGLSSLCDSCSLILPSSCSTFFKFFFTVISSQAIFISHITFSFFLCCSTYSF